MVDYLALAVSLFAVWISFREMRRTNSPIIAIVRGGYTYRTDLKQDQGRGFHEYSVVIRNLGVALHEPEMVLVFREPHGLGTLHLPLKRDAGRPARSSEFARGMIGVFAMRTCDTDPDFPRWLSRLEDLGEQEAHLVVYSQGYEVHAISLGGLRWKILRRWNTLARHVNRRFDRPMLHGVKPGNVLSRLTDLNFQLRLFIQEATREPEASPRSNGGKSP